MALMESQSITINFSRASHAIREGSVNSMKVDYRFLRPVQSHASPTHAYHRSRRPGWQARPYGFQVPVQYEGVKEDAPPRGLLHGLGKVACYIPGPLVELGLCSTIRKGWRFSSRMVHSSDGGEGPPHYQLDRAAIQRARGCPSGCR